MDERTRRVLAALAADGMHGYAAIRGCEVLAVLPGDAIATVRRRACRGRGFWAWYLPRLSLHAIGALLCLQIPADPAIKTVVMLAAGGVMGAMDPSLSRPRLTYIAHCLAEDIPVLKNQRFRLERIPEPPTS